MMHILDQRLQAQAIHKEKAGKVIARSFFKNFESFSISLLTLDSFHCLKMMLCSRIKLQTFLGDE